MSGTALVVLGCRIAPDGRPGPAARRRCEIAAQAFHLGRTDWVLVSGGQRWHGWVEAESMANALTIMGVPPRLIVAEPTSRNTFENAWFSGLLLRSLDARSVTIVTCDYHVSRALRQFRSVGVPADALPVPTPNLTRSRGIALRCRELGSSLLQAPLGILWTL